MTALAKQRPSKVKQLWLGRWRFTNDGVFMAREGTDLMDEFHAPDGSTRGNEKAEKYLN
ncbi:MAG: hypothetical protein ACREP5_00615 [Candidatus Binatia bacterium]